MASSISKPIKILELPSVPFKGAKGPGTHLGTFHGQPIRLKILFVIFLPASLAVLAPCAYGYVRAIEVYGNNGPSAALAVSYPWFMLAAFALIPLLWLALIHLRRSHFFISIYENGLWLRFATRKPVWLAWQKIAGIASGSIQERWLAFTLHTYHYATIFPTTGNPIRLDDRLEDLNLFIERFKEQIYPSLRTDYKDDFKKDRWIHFGPISLQRQGFRISNQSQRSSLFGKVIRKPYSNSELIPWNSVSSLTVKKGYLIIKLKQGRPIRQAVLTIPNLDLLLEILDWGINT